MTKMYDRDFDPLTVLQDLQGQVLQIGKNVTQIAIAHNQMRELQQQMVGQMNQMIEAINQHDTSLYDLHDRVRLLEAARQYENTKQTIHTFGTTSREIDNQNIDVGQTHMRDDVQ
jgi:methyl-accepting chemotaxis protein